MILDLNKDFDRKKLREYVEYLLKRQVIVEVKERKKQRTLSQNSYLHVLLSYFASETGYDLESVKYDLFKRRVNRDIFARERSNKNGQTITYMRSTRDLDTGEMTTAIDRFRNWSSSEAGIYLPEANEYDALMEAERQIAMYEKYL